MVVYKMAEKRKAKDYLNNEKQRYGKEKEILGWNKEDSLNIWIHEYRRTNWKKVYEEYRLKQTLKRMKKECQKRDSKWGRFRGGN